MHTSISIFFYIPLQNSSNAFFLLVCVSSYSLPFILKLVWQLGMTLAVCVFKYWQNLCSDFLEFGFKVWCQENIGVFCGIQISSGISCVWVHKWFFHEYNLLQNIGKIFGVRCRHKAQFFFILFNWILVILLMPYKVFCLVL